MATKIIHATGSLPFDLSDGNSPGPPLYFDWDSNLDPGSDFYNVWEIGMTCTLSGGAEWHLIEQDYWGDVHASRYQCWIAREPPNTVDQYGHQVYYPTGYFDGSASPETHQAANADIATDWYRANNYDYIHVGGNSIFVGTSITEVTGFKRCTPDVYGKVTYGYCSSLDTTPCRLFYTGKYTYGSLPVSGTIHVTDVFVYCRDYKVPGCVADGGGGTGDDIGEDMVADMMDNVIVCAWTDNSGTLKTSVQRHPEKAIGQTQVNQAWTSPLMLGTSIQRYLGLMYLPGSDLFLTTAAAGSSGSWINRKHGGDVAGDWLAQSGQNGQYSAVGRGQESAFFFQTGNTWATSPPSAPADTGNIIQWLRSDVTNLQSPVVDGDDIAIGWTDISGAFNDSSTGGSQPPLYKTNQVNGHDSVRFSGANSCFMQGSFTLNPPFHIFAVMKQISWTSNHILLGDWTGAASTKFKLVQHTTSPKISINDGTGFSTDNADLPVGTWAIVEIIIPSSGALTLRVNNGTSTAGLNPVNGDRGGITLATARGASSTLYGNVEFAEVITYQVALSTTDADITRAYLNGQYNCY